MNRIVVAGVALLAGAVALSAQAESPPGDTGPGRFTFRDVPDGVLRLDADSGRVSVCSKRGAGWICEAVPEAAAALDAEIGRLQDENASLKRELLAHGLSLPEGQAAGSQLPRPNARAPDLPSDADLDRVLTFLDKLWHRLVDMVQNMQKQRADNGDGEHANDGARGIALRALGSGAAPASSGL